MHAALLMVLCTGFTGAQTPDSLAARIDRVMSRPEFRHANFGIEFYSLDTGKVVYALNADKMFVPASTTKLLTEGAVLAKLGADYRFQTRIYRSGPLDSKGRLKGDLVLVASGDPNLSNRILPDGTLAFVDEDHSYNGPAVPGDPLTVIKQLAKDVSSKGVRRIEGRVLVDASLVPDGAREGGTNVVMSSIMVNDNVIDVTVTPGAKAGDRAAIATSPQTSYVKFSGQVLTSSSSGKASLDTSDPIVNADGTTSVLITGTIPAGAPAETLAVGVLSPTNFAQTVLREALAANGISIKPPKKTDPPIFPTYLKFYVPENLLAEHTSLPLSEEVKVTLKVSQNLHAGMGPYLLGALAAKNARDLRQAGFGMEQQFLQEAKLDMSGISQGDGEGGDWADLFSPDFMVQYLKYWTKRPEYPVFFKALPILGRDGTLAKIQTASPGAGYVFAKTGTFGSEDRVNGKVMLNGKGLAGYVITAKGEKLAFAAYVNHVSLPPDPDAPQSVAGQALGEIAAAAYDARFEPIANGN
ncbi:MAG TPA: D-alanyl-D-alanine carboxypeptidase/D-alanyl-D-alanine-endopeptidase [Candidatus Eisenbacteria bacterium]|jgi:D-alanyl-D-alanine carboxypeptidase/D-alanyl-D-alanine-endopeptidase (penicillin-binding protein 4)|nr:D-alanyl-D-alanine carboxypeptidase/D-alanyl-D-alanine-endopeptidase [Candidatus Eisenbacteria bacterium]